MPITIMGESYDEEAHGSLLNALSLKDQGSGMKGLRKSAIWRARHGDVVGAAQVAEPLLSVGGCKLEATTIQEEA